MRIPRSLANLRVLETLRFSGNSLESVIPTGLGALSSLTFLSLTQNALRGALPQEVDRLHGPLGSCSLRTTIISIA